MSIEDKEAENDKNWWQRLETATKFGVLVTAIVFIAIGIYAYNFPGAFKNIIGDANEMGDFLAGTAGTLALVWLIVGYFLQSKELNENTKALERQADETRKMFEFHESRYQDEIRRKAEEVKPIFKRAFDSLDTALINHQNIFEIDIKNIGIKIPHISGRLICGNFTLVRSSTPFGEDERLDFKFQVTSEIEDWPIQIHIFYKDKFGNYFVEMFFLYENGDFVPHGERESITKEAFSNQFPDTYPLQNW